MLASARGHLKVDMSPQLVKATGPALQHVAAHVLKCMSANACQRGQHRDCTADALPGSGYLIA
jgi:hypothetical protein